MLARAQDGPKKRTTITFTQYSSNADVIEEYYLMDFSAFISAVGGDMGIFIGAGVLTLIESIIGITHEYLLGRK